MAPVIRTGGRKHAPSGALSRGQLVIGDAKSNANGQFAPIRRDILVTRNKKISSVAYLVRITSHDDA
jgi:hypothetical protein